MLKFRINIKKINLILGIILITNTIFAQDGKVLFEDNCTACHTMGMKVVGPNLVGITDRRDDAWIKAFITNSQKVIESGDEYANKLYAEYNNVQMNSHDFSEEELTSIVDYLRNWKPEEVIVADVSTPTNNTTADVAAPKTISKETYILISIITVPVLLVIFLLFSILFKIMIFEKGVSGETENVATELFTGKITDEVIEGHSYDGIMELNNGMPPWLVWLFYATMGFAIVYLAHFQFMKTGPSQAQEYDNEMAEAVAIYGDVDVVSVKIEHVTDEVALASGKEAYDKNCIACHKADGGGSVGPNLTDNYWKNGGSLSDVFNTIRNGVPGKAMVAWKGKISDKDILSIASYIKNMKGTNPEGAKEAEGTEYKE